jgi:hypothetical protein
MRCHGKRRYRHNREKGLFGRLKGGMLGISLSPALGP